MGSATDAALNTTELLEKIIIQLPPTDITRFVRVSKRWRSLIMDSPSIGEVRCLKPLLRKDDNEIRTDEGIEWEREFPDLSRIVQYDTNSWVTFHQLFNIGKFGDIHADLTVTYQAYAEIIFCDLRGYEQVWDAYATFPPCQAVSVHAYFLCGRDLDRDPTRDKKNCLVSVKEGVRVRDLLNFGKQLLENESGTHHKYSPRSMRGKRNLPSHIKMMCSVAWKDLGKES